MKTKVKVRQPRQYNTGNLAGIAKDLFLLVKEHPASTLGELASRYKGDKPRSRGELSKRMAELLRWGCVTKGEARVCTFSGREACTWVAAPGIPGRPTEDKTSADSVITATSAEESELQKEYNRLVEAFAELTDERNDALKRIESSVEEYQSLHRVLMDTKSDLRDMSTKAASLSADLNMAKVDGQSKGMDGRLVATLLCFAIFVASGSTLVVLRLLGQW